MLSYAPAHAPVMGMTSDQPSGIHPIRVLYGSILGHFEAMGCACRVEPTSWLFLNLGGSSNGQKGRNNLSDVLLPLSAPSAPQPRPSRLIRAATRSSKVHEWRCCDREGGVLDRERGNKVVDHWRS